MVQADAVLSQSIAPWLIEARDRILQLRQADKLSHALLLMGRDGGGHHQLASVLAQDLLCHTRQGAACGQCHGCQLMQAKTHPDFHMLDGREETIKIDQIRDILSKVSQKPQIGQSKVVFIAQASSMNINSANAILKALEEPPAETFFILTSDANSSLLPTIRSRCLLTKLPAPTQAQINDWFAHQETPDGLSDLLWVSEEPFTLLSLVRSNSHELYINLPNELKDFVEGNLALEDFAAKIDNKNNGDFLRALSALSHQCIHYSTGQQVPNQMQLQALFDLLLSRLGIHKIMECFRRLQELTSNSHKTHLNMPLQIKAELLFWIS